MTDLEYRPGLCVLVRSSVALGGGAVGRVRSWPHYSTHARGKVIQVSGFRNPVPIRWCAPWYRQMVLPLGAHL